MSGDIIRAGVIGCGGMGSHHVKTLASHSAFELVAGCDIDPDALGNLPSEAARHASAEAMFAEHELDLVSVIVPNHLYEPMVKLAADHGACVFTEKPFGHSLASCRRMIAALEAKGLGGWVGAQRKYHAHFQEARRVLASRDVDFVGLIFTYFWGPAYTGPGWRGDRAKSGGVAVIDSGWHALDALSWFLGDPADVFCQLTCLDGHPDIDDTAAVQLRYPRGACGSIVISYTQPKSRMDFTFCCGHETVYLSYDGLQLYDGPDEVRQMEAMPHEAVFPAMYDELAKAYGGDSSAFVTDMRRAEGIMQVVDAAYRSAESADVVHLPQSPSG